MQTNFTLETRSSAHPGVATTMSYPTVPPHASYTSCYCEENIYLLAASFFALPDFRKSWDLTVVFISNQSKTASDPLPLDAISHVPTPLMCLKSRLSIARIYSGRPLEPTSGLRGGVPCCVGLSRRPPSPACVFRFRRHE